jgi:hypothetical protein
LRTLFKVSAPVCISPAVFKNSDFSTSSPTPLLYEFFYYSHSNSLDFFS